MNKYRVVHRRTEVITLEVEADNALVAHRMMRDDATMTNREYQNEVTMIEEIS